MNLVIENNRREKQTNIITEKETLKQNQCNQTNQSNKSRMRIEFNKMENKGIELKNKSTKQNSFNLAY